MSISPACLPTLIGSIALSLVCLWVRAGDCSIATGTTAFDASTITGGAAALGSSDDIAIDATQADAKAVLATALCASYSAVGICNDTTPRIIRINGTIDFTEDDGGTTTSPGCIYSENNCRDGEGQEQILADMDYCTGKPTFPVRYQQAGTKPLVVGANKTIVGIGANSGLKGKGLNLKGSPSAIISNVVVRNLNLTDINEGTIWAGDAVQMNYADKIWIDHNTFSRVGRQFIAAGTGNVTNLKISDNLLDGTTGYGHYCNGRHYWNVLLYANNISATVVRNWFKNTSGRSPEIKSDKAGGIVHVANNYFSGNDRLGVSTSTNVMTVLEGNYFSKSPTGNFFPIAFGRANDTIDLSFAPLGSNIDRAEPLCRTALGRSCVSNYDGGNRDVTNKFTIDNAVFDRYVSRSTAAVQGLKTYAPIAASEVPAYVQAHAGTMSDLK